MNENHESENGFPSVIREHPFQSGALIASSTVFICSCIGFFREYLILKEFNINVVTYAELNDFLVAGLKDPYVLAIFPLVIGLFIFTYFYAMKRSFISSPMKYAYVIFTLYPFIIAFAYIPMYSVKDEIEVIKGLQKPLSIKLRNREELKKVSLISTTEKFVFVWSDLKKTPLVLTTSNIVSITYEPSI